MNQQALLLGIVHAVLQKIEPEALLRNHLLKACTLRTFEKFQKIAVISIGKAARPMAQAVLNMLPRQPDYLALADTGHPLPTIKGLLKTQKIISIAKTLGSKDLAIVLISGGGSSMLVNPVPPITLTDKIKTTQALLRCGAPIKEINVVRKHLSRVKGGRLAELLAPATVWGFIMSDVVGNDLSTIASGPLSPDSSTFSDTVRILKKYKIKIPPGVLTYLQAGQKDKKLETPKPRSHWFKNVKLKIIADHFTVAKLAAEEAKKRGLRVTLKKKLITGEARTASGKFLKLARKNSILIGCGETTVTCRGQGDGGRNQEFVLAGLPYLQPGQTLLSMGTDGVDGICPDLVAGAAADYSTLQESKKKKLNIKKFLNNNDSYGFFNKAGGHIKTGPTGTNLGDLAILFSEPIPDRKAA